MNPRQKLTQTAEAIIESKINESASKPIVTISELLILIRAGKIQNIDDGAVNYSPYGLLPILRLTRNSNEILVTYLINDGLNGVYFHDLCELSKTHLNVAKELIRLYFEAIDKQFHYEQNRLLQNFFSNASYQDLLRISSKHFLWASISLPAIIKFNPPFLKDTANDLIEEKYCTTTNVFEKHLNIDLKEAISQSRYQSQPKCEGYWKDEYRNEAAYNLAFSKRAQLNTTEDKKQLLETLQKMTLEEKINDSYRLPVPETKPWQGQEALIECLAELEKRSLLHGQAQETQIRNRISIIIPSHKANTLDLLEFHIIQHSRTGFAMPRLPSLNPEQKRIDNSGSEFRIKLSNGKYLSWTDALINYIKYYNIIPSKEFLENFQQFLLDCKTKHIPKTQYLRYELAKARSTIINPKTTALLGAAIGLLFFKDTRHTAAGAVFGYVGGALANTISYYRSKK
ncbi:hypothetical protein AYO45_05470 [Gammaproteobacteria bacterium SCGC AG-212-F23]|nr:hypothetical protein AYO45_05470 [Gammaproteobacteria bacterium SCGC AG-212-F23]